MDNLKKYLPSKKFTSSLLIIIIIIIIFFSVKGLISLLGKNKIGKGNPTPLAVAEIVQQDANHNGIADWEEYLWGLDPAKNGPANKAFIDSKKSMLTQSGDITPEGDSKTITQNALLSRQFFATIMSLQEGGQLDDTAIASISEAIGQNIKAEPIADAYSMNMINLVKDSDDANYNYFMAYSGLITKYGNQNIGSELTIVSQGIINKDPQALYAAQTIATAYKNFSSELLKIPVPSSIAIVHLSLANDYEKTSQAIDGLTKVITDPIIGMKSLLNYKKYSDLIGVDMTKLSNLLQ